MKVLVDTSVWSLALRRNRVVSQEAEELKRLVEENRVEIIGPIRQEILSGVPNKTQFDLLREQLSAFPDIPLRTDHFEMAVEFNNLCRRSGIQGSHTDFLICSVAHLEKLSIFTTDGDFRHYSKRLPIQVHEGRMRPGKG
jgi:predicted nucleic acid-binding protein